MPGLWDLFAGLPTPASRGTYSSHTLEAESGYRIARSYDSRPTLLIDVAGIPGVASLMDLRSQYIAVHHGRRFEVTSADGQQAEGTFSQITCLSEDILIQKYFVDFLPTFAQLLGDHPSASAISDTVNSVLELFAALRQAPRTTLQGAWTELLLIAEAKDPAVVANAWHLTVGDTYDFSAGVHRVEAKSSSGERRHHFTWEQLTPPHGVELLIASSLVRVVAGGTSIADLLNKIREELADHPDLIQHVERTLALTLGDSMLDGLHQPLDKELALESLKYFRSEDVPRPASPFPQGVSHVAFVSDLSSVEPVTAEWLAARANFFDALP